MQTSDSFQGLELEKRFIQEVASTIEECRSLGYPPSIWQDLVVSKGAVQASKDLVVASKVQPGFKKLIKMGRPDLTVEFLVMQPEYRPLFEEKHIQAAEFRLANWMNIPGGD